MMNRTHGEDLELEDWDRRSDAMLGVAGGLAAVTVVVAVLTRWDDEDEAEDDEGATDAPSDDVPDDEVAGATGALPDASVIPTRGGAVLTVGWRR